MRLIVLIRSFNPRRTQFILQDIETRVKSFNPRAHTGRDTRAFLWKFCFASFNPRAHTGRDTRAFLWKFCFASFNPRAHTGRDHGKRKAAHDGLMFQSTRPHGARHNSTTSATFMCLFQSTRPHGARQYIQQTPEYLYSKLHFLRDMANIHAKLFLLSPTITNYLKLKHCESIAI